MYTKSKRNKGGKVFKKKTEEKQWNLPILLLEREMTKSQKGGGGSIVKHRERKNQNNICIIVYIYTQRQRGIRERKKEKKTSKEDGWVAIINRIIMLLILQMHRRIMH